MKSNLDRWRRALVGSAVMASALVASCGGGQQVQAFRPDRVISFGDETSVLDDFKGDANARKYTVNATVSATDATLDCKQHPLWIQSVASFYSLVFPQCNPQPNAVAAPASRARAVAGAKVADLAAQIDAQLAESPFNGKDLVTILIGQNDVLAQYAQYPAVDEPQLIANLDAAGKALGEQINRIATAGAKVVVSTVPDQGLTPFATAEFNAHPEFNRATLLSRLTARLNGSMRATIINDGRMIGLILTDEYFQAIERVVNAGGFSNVTTPVCDLTKSALVPPSILDCTSLTLISGGDAGTYLWADTTHLSSGGQLALGSLATTRVTSNPF